MARLNSPSSPKDAVPLTPKEQMAAWDAGYDMASLFHSKGRPLDVDGIFLETTKRDRRVPRNLNEDHPSFWEWRHEVVEAVKSFAESVDERVRLAGVYDNTYVLTGRTFQNKDLIRDIFPGAIWDGRLKRWLAYGGGNAMTSNVWTLRRSGVKVDVVPGIRLEPGDPIPDKLASQVADTWLGKTATRYNPRMVSRMSAEEAMEALDDLSLSAGRKARVALDDLRLEAREAERDAKILEKAWTKWDWDTLARFNIVTKEEANFAAEVLARYTDDTPLSGSRRASQNFAGINVRSFQQRKDAWWDDMAAILEEWWSFQKVSVKRSRGKIVVVVPTPQRTWEIEVRGPVEKPTVYVGGASKTFGPDANILKDIMYWIDGITRP